MRVRVLARFPKAHIVEIDAPIETLVSRLIIRDTLNRVDTGALEQEIKLGRSIASHTFDSSRESADSIAEAIAQLV